MDFAINLWNKNKILFIIAVPALLLFIFKDVIMALLTSSAHQTVEDATKEDEKLRKEQEALKIQAEKAKSEAQAAKEQREKRTADDIPEDWNTKIRNEVNREYKKVSKKVSPKKAKTNKAKRKTAKTNNKKYRK